MLYTCFECSDLNQNWGSGKWLRFTVTQDDGENGGDERALSQYDDYFTRGDPQLEPHIQRAAMDCPPKMSGALCVPWQISKTLVSKWSHGKIFCGQMVVSVCCWFPVKKTI